MAMVMMMVVVVMMMMMMIFRSIIVVSADTSSGPNRWSNLSIVANPPWKRRGFGLKSTWLAHIARLGKQLHPLFQEQSDNGLGLSNAHIGRDGLHVVCIGILPHLLGSVFWLFCFTDVLGAMFDSASSRMDYVWAQIDKLYKSRRTSCQFTFISLRSFCDPSSPNADYPILGGKAAELRHLVPIVLSIWQQFYRPRMQFESWVRDALFAMDKFYDVLSYTSADGTYPFFLPTLKINELQSNIDQFLDNYLHLTAHCFDRGMHLFNLVPKFHYMWHIGEQAVYLNPRVVWVYSNEDWVGRLALIGESCRYRLPAALRSGLITSKWSTGLALRFKHGRR